jgi:hypothetical protein
MKIATTRPKPYKGYMIVGVAIEAPALKAWKFRGIVYARNSRKELKRLNYLKQSACVDKRRAQYYGLEMCRYWIDRLRAKVDRRLVTGTPRVITSGKSVKVSRSNRTRDAKGTRQLRKINH